MRMARFFGAAAALVFCSALFVVETAAFGRGGGGGGGGGGGAVFNVMSFDAKPGTNRESTQAFIRAWNAACMSNTQATLLIPPGIYLLGEIVFQGPCKSQLPITVLLQGTLQAVSDASAYSGDGWISFEQVNGLVVTGGGTIDGRGQALWQYNDCKTNPSCILLPASLYMNRVSNGKVKNINLINSMGFHIHVVNCYMLRFFGLKITAPADSPNTDGIHISKSTNVRFYRNVISTGDDCVSIGQGSTNVTIEMITCGPGHGISVGSLGKLPKEMDVTGLTVKNCTLVGTANGIRIKTYPASDPSSASEILFQDITMNNVHNPIIIDQNYGAKSSQPSLVKISNVFYQNIRGTTSSPVAVSLTCSALVPCQNVHLQDINLQYNGNTAAPSSLCTNAKVAYGGVQIPPPCHAL